MFPNRNTPKQERRRLRHFGLLVGGIFALIGFWQLYRGHHETARVILWSIGGLLIGFGLIAPKLLAPIYAAWMKLAFLLGWVNSRILLSVIFFFLFTPIALVTRIFGRDALGRRLDRNAISYWIEREPVQSIQEHCERQY
ncbi:MAG: SxtJ family membrane protein [Verrucomicrobia bacterium]|nr:SxtJ family membrane protein [Verrucomicrobiota bacterium]